MANKERISTNDITDEYYLCKKCNIKTCRSKCPRCKKQTNHYFTVNEERKTYAWVKKNVL